MKLKVTYLSALFCLVFLLGIPQTGAAQSDLGIIWNAPDDTEEAASQLKVFAAHGIQHIEVVATTPQNVLNLFEKFDFSVSVRNSISFLTVSDVHSQKNELLKQYRTFIQEFASNPHVSSLGVFSNSQTADPDFFEAFQPIFDTLLANSDKSLYFHKDIFWHDVGNPNVPFGVTFADATFSLSDIPEFNQVFQKNESIQTNTVTFIYDTWFLDAVTTYPPFSETIKAYISTGNWLLPLPNVEKESTHRPWMVFFLLIIWLGLVIEIKYLPYLRSTIIRYFFAHRFFVEDVLQYRERAARGSFFMLIKHALIVGMVVYMFFKTGVSETGLEAFFYHFPMFSIFGKSYISLIILGTLAAVIIQGTALLWLHLPSKKTKYFGQAVNIYAGALFLNLIVVTLLTILYAAHFNPTTVYICSSVFLLIWYNAFHVAAFDISSKGEGSRIIYLLLTIGLHILLSVGGVILILSKNEWLDVLRLSFSL